MTSLTDVRALFRQILHLRESPHRTALAFAVGVFIGFSPTYGLHMIMVAFCTWAFGLNFVALMAGAFLNNPWTLVPILGATFWTGARLLGETGLPSFNLGRSVVQRDLPPGDALRLAVFRGRDGVECDRGSGLVSRRLLFAL